MREAAAMPEPMSDRDKKRIACTPDDYERVHDAAAVTGYEQFFTVISSAAVPPGVVFVLQPEAEFDRELETVGEKLHAELLETMQREIKRDVEVLKARLRYEAELRLLYKADAGPNWRPGFGAVAGL
jgi:hypothetical protein